MDFAKQDETRHQLVTFAKGGLNTDPPYKFKNLVKGGSRTFKGGLNPPDPPANRALISTQPAVSAIYLSTFVGKIKLNWLL